MSTHMQEVILSPPVEFSTQSYPEGFNRHALICFGGGEVRRLRLYIYIYSIYIHIAYNLLLAMLLVTWGCPQRGLPVGGGSASRATTATVGPRATRRGDPGLRATGAAATAVKGPSSEGPWGTGLAIHKLWVFLQGHRPCPISLLDVILKGILKGPFKRVLYIDMLIYIYICKYLYTYKEIYYINI